MSILTRFGNVMASNVKDLFIKEEDPIKEINKYLKEIESDLGSIKAETAAIMAAEQRATRELNECNDNINKFQKYAEKALQAGSESDARNFLAKKNQFIPKQAMLKQNQEFTTENSIKMAQMQEKLINDTVILNDRLEEVKSKMEMAKGNGSLGSGNTKMEEMNNKADKMLYKAKALEEVNNISNNDDNLDVEFAALLAEDKKSDNISAPSTNVDDDIAAMKAKMGI